MSQRGFRSTRLLVSSVTLGALLGPVDAHEFVPRSQRVGAYPPHPGTGWFGEAFLDLPGTAALNLIAAEQYLNGNKIKPDFTFRATWIDFPAGPEDSNVDSEFATIGDFLDDYIFDVSDPSKLNEPMSHFFLRFTGLVKVRLQDEVRTELTFVGMPVWVDFATQGYDGYRTKVGDSTAYRTPDVNLNGNPWAHFGPAIEALGLYPITITYFNRYDPTGTLDAPRAGVELYGCYGSDKTWPAGKQMSNEEIGCGTLVPPEVIYPLDDFVPIEKGDFDGDADLDLRDFQWLQFCGDPTFFLLPTGCHIFDVNDNNKVTRDEIDAFLAAFSGPVQPEDQRGGP